MRANQDRPNRNRSGFTLLEILVVVGIIALLAALVVPSFINVEDNQKRKLAESLVSGNGPIATPIKIFRSNMDRYPNDLSELTQPPDDEEDARKWQGPYIEDARSLKDPWGREIKYAFPAQAGQQSYDLWSTGPNGIDGDEDDVRN
jgi:general secretion pathway protein G